MRTYLKSIIVPAASAVVGGAIVLAGLKLSPSLQAKFHFTENKSHKSEDAYDDIIKKHEGIRHQFDNLFEDDFFGGGDPFDEMKKMRKQMENRLERFGAKNHTMSNPFDTWFSDKFGGGTVNDISKREDDNFVYYDLKVEDIKSTSINTKVENGYVTITGTVEKKSELPKSNGGDDFSSESFYKSNFTRTFPLPEHVDQNKMEMASEKDKIVLKFPKVKA